VSDRWTGVGLLVAAVLCCAGPVLIGAGLAGAALGLVRQHWGWIAGGAGLVAVVVLLRLRRAGAV
jgi:hypothetical protein